jgi:glycosyltransferase involved in cell wall biosynthesis
MAGEPGTHGGAEVDIRNIAAELSSHGELQVIVACTADRPDFVAEPSVTGAPGPIPVRCLPAPPNPGGNPWILRLRILVHWWRLYRAIRALPFDVLITKPACMETGIALLACEHTGRAGVYRIAHDWETDLASLTRPVFGGNGRLARWFLRRMARARAVLAQTEIQKRALHANLGVEALVLPNSHRITEEDPQARAGNDTVLWAGRIHPMKNPAALLRLARSLPGVRFRMLVMRNAGLDDLFESIRAEATSLPNVEWVADTPPQEMPREYAEAGLFVLTSQSEGFANVLIEAMRAALPIVTLEVNPDGLFHTNLEDLTDKNPDQLRPGYCARGNEENLAWATERILRDKRLWTSLSQSARSYAQNHHSAKTNGLRYLRLIQNLTKGCPMR